MRASTVQILDEVYDEQYQRDSVDRKALAAYEAIASAICNVLAPYHRITTHIDFGSGAGALVKAMQDRGFVSIGIEGSIHAITHACCPQIYQYDLRERHATRPWKFDAYSIVTCFDVAEHIEPEYADTLIDHLVSAVTWPGTILFGAAPPGQDGRGHVNMQPPSYWETLFYKRDLGHNKALTDRLRDEIAKDGRHSRCWWVHKNITAYQFVQYSWTPRMP